MLTRMTSLKDKIQAKAEIVSAIAEVAEEKVRPKAKTLKIKVAGKIKTKKK